MSKEVYNIYINDIIALTRSMVIKLDDVADATNYGVVDRGYTVLKGKPETWKYYLNLAGEYHQADTMMYVKSFDTLETVPFTKETLAEHLSTARAYRWGTDDYEQLLRQYPDQVDLINGIIQPISFDVAYNAPNGKILKYETSYVESQEDDLMLQVQTWIYNFIDRWYSAGYAVTDEYYLPAFLSCFFPLLSKTIATLRMHNCRTEKAHSFHIREYLKSHGDLGDYFPYLSLKQKLWLYRNIEYLRHNVGKKETFGLLVEHFLTDRNIPLTAYDIVQNYDRLPNEIYPDTLLRKKPVNYAASEATQTVTVKEMLEKESTLALKNAEVQPEYETSIHRLMRSSKFADLPTKIFESEAVDMSSSDIKLFKQTLMSEWLYLATHGQYRAYIRIHNPVNGELLTLSVRDAFILMWYCWHKANHITLETIPTLEAMDVVRTPLPTLTELRKLSNTFYVHDEHIKTLHGMITPSGQYISTEAFYEACVTFQADWIDSWRWVSSFQHLRRYSILSDIRMAHYKNVACRLIDKPTTYTEWLRTEGIVLDDLSVLDYERLATDLFSYATGSNLHSTITFSDIQTTMLALTAKLSSYSVQFLKTISYSKFTFIGFPFPRVGDLSCTTANQYSRIQQPSAEVLNSSQKDSFLFNMTHGQSTQLNVDFKEHLNQHTKIDAHLGVHIGSQPMGTLRFGVNNVDIINGNITVTHNDLTVDDLLPGFKEGADTEVIKADGNGPGPKTLLVGDMTRGFFGTLSSNELFNGRSLSTALQFDVGALGNGDLTWFKFAYHGEILYYPSTGLRSDITYQDLLNAKLTNRQRGVSVNGYSFVVKLPELLPQGASNYTVHQAIDGNVTRKSGLVDVPANGLVPSEFCDLMVSLVTELPYPDKFPAELMTTQYTPASIGLSYQNSTDDAFFGLGDIHYTKDYDTELKKESTVASGVVYESILSDADTHDTSFLHFGTADVKLNWRPVLVLI